MAAISAIGDFLLQGFELFLIYKSPDASQFAFQFRRRKGKIDFQDGRNLGLFVCVEVLRPSQPNGVMSSAVSLPNHTFTGQA